MVWARGDLNFVGADLRTVHNMNVKMGVVLQQLIAKELTVADALEEVCAQCDGGELTTREKRMLRDIKACGRALTTIAAEQGEQVSATSGSFASKVVQTKLANDARRASGDMKTTRVPLLEVKAINARAALQQTCIGELVTPVRSKRKVRSSSTVRSKGCEDEVMMPSKGATFTPEHAITHLAGLSKSLRAATLRAWCSDAANVIPMQVSGINKRLKMFKQGQTGRAFKPWNDAGRENIATSAEIQQWVSSHQEGETFGEAEMRHWLQAKNGVEVSPKTVKTYVAHAMYFSETVTENAKFKQASRLTAEQSLRRPQAYACVLLNTMILPGPSLCGGPQPPKVCVCACVCERVRACMCAVVHVCVSVSARRR